ncbi:hypothetical protein [Paenibacillus glycanilyticus]|uniref:Uncharacterized protein n=1 Tax=Paenibacillus glycanilyticus TaxID=126569 RepID=A0ABQ6GJV5_9BACL|nr:hypothetical protein [Paenibacillus glycanilyticus]GLX70360.1 hypothetical protein MU1_47060 [Paenibacillus glycanilyticus]
MANPKWVKWVVGISSVALFTGMVGVINHSSAPSTTAPASSDVLNSGPSDENMQGDDSADSFQQRSFGGGRGRGFGSESGAGSGSSDEGMRTHAS